MFIVSDVGPQLVGHSGLVDALGASKCCDFSAFQQAGCAISLLASTDVMVVMSKNKALKSKDRRVQYCDVKYNKAMTMTNRDLQDPRIMKARWHALGPECSQRVLARIAGGPLSKVAQNSFFLTFPYMVSYKYEVVKHLEKRGREALVVQRILALFDVRQPGIFCITLQRMHHLGSVGFVLSCQFSDVLTFDL